MDSVGVNESESIEKGSRKKTKQLDTSTPNSLKAEVKHGNMRADFVISHGDSSTIVEVF